MGAGRILLGTDYPCEDPKNCMEFLEGLSLSQQDIEKIYHGNANPLGIAV